MQICPDDSFLKPAVASVAPEGLNASATLISNHSAFVSSLSNIVKDFNTMFRRKAYLNPFVRKKVQFSVFSNLIFVFCFVFFLFFCLFVCLFVCFCLFFFFCWVLCVFQIHTLCRNGWNGIRGGGLQRWRPDLWVPDVWNAWRTACYRGWSRSVKKRVPTDVFTNINCCCYEQILYKNLK